MATGYVIIDLNATAPSGPGVTFRRYGPALPRHQKQALEVQVCKQLLTSLAHHDSAEYCDVRSNEDDPPDVWFTRSGVAIGVELAELVPPGRLHKDAEIGACRRLVTEALSVGPNTRDWAISITTHDDYAPRLRLRRSAAGLAAALDAFFSAPPQASSGPVSIPVPAGLPETIRAITASKSYLADDPRIANRDEPLVTFTAQHTNLVPARHFPEMVRRVLVRKMSHSVAGITWLVLWSGHFSLARFDTEIASEIDNQLKDVASPYERCFYVHALGRGAIHEIVQVAA